MIAVDTNVLVHAHRRESEWHAAAAEALRTLAEGAQWAIPWPCLHEFHGVVTHARIYKPPSTVTQAVHQIELWLESPRLTLLGETELGWPVLRDLVRSRKVSGPQIHDARIAALCLQHGIDELWSCDRDFSRFPELRVVNPLVPATSAHERRARYRTTRSHPAR